MIKTFVNFCIVMFLFVASAYANTAAPEIVVTERANPSISGKGQGIKSAPKKAFTVPLFKSIKANSSGKPADIEVTPEIEKLAEDLCESITNPKTQACSLNYKLKAIGVPNDPSFSQLYGMTKISAKQAWDKTTGSAEVIIGVIDSGVDYNHPDLAANMWKNAGEIPGNGVDDDANGYVDDYYGYNFFGNNSNPMDDNSHGTHCAGTIGGVGNNGQGVTGVAWNVKMIAVKFLGADGSGYLSGAVNAIEYLTKLKLAGHNVVASNNSWGGGGYSSALQAAISKANDAGILFVAAAGNSSTNNDSAPHYPSSYNVPNVVSVASTDNQDNLSSFSCYGPNSVHLAAPGSAIYSTIHANRYASYSGTSMATPHVSGAVALLKSHRPTMTASQLKTALLNGVDKLSNLQGYVSTAGRLNVIKAMDYWDNYQPPEEHHIGSLVTEYQDRQVINLLISDGDITIPVIGKSASPRTFKLFMNLGGHNCGQIAAFPIPANAAGLSLKGDVPDLQVRRLKGTISDAAGTQLVVNVVNHDQSIVIESEKSTLSTSQLQTYCDALGAGLNLE